MEVPESRRGQEGGVCRGGEGRVPCRGDGLQMIFAVWVFCIRSEHKAKWGPFGQIPRYAGVSRSQAGRIWGSDLPQMLKPQRHHSLDPQPVPCLLGRAPLRRLGSELELATGTKAQTLNSGFWGHIWQCAGLAPSGDDEGPPRTARVDPEPSASTTCTTVC